MTDGQSVNAFGEVHMRKRRCCRELAFAIGLVVAIGVTGCDPATQRELEVSLSNAKARIRNLKAEEDTRIVNNEMDYGVSISFTLTNAGEAGLIRVSPWLSSSEGEWSRQQTLNVGAGQAINLTYFFPEPTINASNVQYGVRTKP